MIAEKDPVIRLENVWYGYNSHSVVENVSLAIHAGDFLAMTGPNGGGKTTLLKLILGLYSPRRGTIRVLGRPPADASHEIGYVPQDVHINPSFPVTALDVVLMGKLSPRRRWGRYTGTDRREAEAALARMGMEHLAGRRIGELSGGQRQRVFIARSLVTRPRVLLLDEPTASIDTKGQIDFYGLLRELNREMTVVVVSHDLLAISEYVKSVACVNRQLHYHRQEEIAEGNVNDICPCTVEEVCPVGLVTQGAPLEKLLHPLKG